MVELKAASPCGEPLATTVVPGNARAIVVQGAALSVVDLSTLDAQGEPLALLAPGAHIELPPLTARTLAFVGDLLGRVLVDDVSWDRLKPAAGSGFTPMPLPGDGSQPLLFPGRIHRFVASPVDGWRPNCTDLEIDEHVLYCATVRDGVQLLEIGPGMPSLSVPPQAPAEGLPVYGVLDTAGMATGLALRRPSALNRQMDQLLVGDNRAGLLVFGRTGN